MKKIRTKLILTLIPIVVAPLLALGINSWGLIENMAREKVNTQSMMLVDSAKEFIKFGVSANKTQLEFLPQSQTLSRYLSAEKSRRQNALSRPAGAITFPPGHA